MDKYQVEILYLMCADLSEIDTIVYLFAGNVDKEMFRSFNKPNCLIVKLQGVAWNHDLSPWYADRVFVKGDDFEGKADAFLEKLTETIIPNWEESMKLQVKHRVIAGYSLGGLFALYACTKTDLFDRAASMSGSLWFDGFVEYLKENSISKHLSHVYLSLGKREKFTKNQRMAFVENATIQTCGILQHRGVTVRFELLEGGHFDEVQVRIANGVDKLIAM